MQHLHRAAGEPEDPGAGRVVAIGRPMLLTLVTLLAASPTTTLETTAQVPPEQDACLDHSVRELGMSAKRVEGERRWTIGPQYLHASVKAGGTLGVRFEKAAGGTTVRVTATWPGGKKDAAVQPELEQRLRDVAQKLAQICGVVRAEVACTVDGAPCGR